MSEDKKPWQFKKGVSPNPGGRPKEIIELKNLVDKCKSDLLRHMSNYAGMTLPRLKNRLDDPKISMLEHIVGRLYLKASSGSLPHAQEIIGRLAGAVPKYVGVERVGDTVPKLNYSGDVLTAILNQIREKAEKGVMDVTDASIQSPQLSEPALLTE